MRILVAGASGAIGTRLVAQLVDHGHEVIGTHRNPGNAARVSALGAVPVELDLLDPVLADVLGAKPPRRVPRWLAKLVAGEAAVMLGTVSRGASNAKARRELGWEPRYPSWRQGFVAAYASTGTPSVRLREVA